MEWTTRRAVKNDKSRINELFIEMIQTINNEKIANGYEEGYLDRFFDNHEDWICAAEINGSVVAYLSIEVHREQENFLYLDDLSVSEKYRGNGIGTELIKTAERFAEEIGISIIALHVEKSNKSAFRLYRRLGYSAVRDEGTRLRMVKRLEFGGMTDESNRIFQMRQTVALVGSNKEKRLAGRAIPV